MSLLLQQLWLKVFDWSTLATTVAPGPRVYGFFFQGRCERSAACDES